MKKIKRIVFDNGNEALVNGKIDIKVSGRTIKTEETIELTDDDAKKVLDNPKKYKLEGKKVKTKSI